MRSKQTFWNPVDTYCFWLGRYPVGYIAYVWLLLSGHVNCGLFVFTDALTVAVQSLSCVRLFVTPWTAACQASLAFTVSWSLLKLTSIELVMPSNHLILSCPLLLPSIFPSIKVFSNESALRIRWPKYWSFSLKAVHPMNIQGWFPLGLTGLIFLQSKGLSRVFSSTTIWRH